MAKEITMDTGWGTKGAQLNGAEVEGFIKSQLKSLIEKDANLSAKIDLLELSTSQDISGLLDKYSEMQEKVKPATDGCYVLYHTKSNSSRPIAVPYWNWKAIEAGGEVADGVVVLIDGREAIVVSTAERRLQWAKEETETTSSHNFSRRTVYTDYDGHSHTDQIMARATEYFGSDKTQYNKYAPAYCALYNDSRSPASDQDETRGVLTEQWWLPSIAEMMLIWKHRHAIDRCLSVISGAVALSDAPYWTSTENGVNQSWYLDLSDGYFQVANQIDNSFIARPITWFR